MARTATTVRTSTINRSTPGFGEVAAFLDGTGKRPAPGERLDHLINPADKCSAWHKEGAREPNTARSIMGIAIPNLLFGQADLPAQRLQPRIAAQQRKSRSYKNVPSHPNRA